MRFSKKGFIQHPVWMFIFAVILGVVIGVLVINNIIPLNLGMCPVK